MRSGKRPFPVVPALATVLAACGDGDTRVARFAIAVVRGDSTVVVYPVAAAEPVPGWRRFAVALLTGPGSRELFFQPVRN